MTRARSLACALFVLAGACGRVRFDERVEPADAPLGHDEDEDGIGDADDPCPHVAGDRADRDDDGVGDACDPRPDTPGERFTVFATLQAGDQPFNDIALFDQEPDALHTNQVSYATSILGTFANTRIDIGFDIHGLVGNGQHQVASGVVATPVYYFVELNENGPMRNASIVSFDQTNGYLMLDARTHNGVHPGRGVLRYDARTAIGGTTAFFALTTGWDNELYMAQAPTTSYAGGAEIRVVVNGLDISLRYVAIIESS